MGTHKLIRFSSYDFRAYDRLAIKFHRVEADINFNTNDYEEDFNQVFWMDVMVLWSSKLRLCKEHCVRLLPHLHNLFVKYISRSSLPFTYFF